MIFLMFLGELKTVSTQGFRTPLCDAMDLFSRILNGSHDYKAKLQKLLSVERIWEEVVMAVLKVPFRHSPGLAEETRMNLSEDSLCSTQNSNR
jgi:hypothetical protein